MAMTTCRECNAQISTRADACPNCGAKVKRTGFLTKAVLGVVLLFVTGSVVGNCQRYSQQAKEVTRREALAPEQRAAEDRAAQAKKQADAEREAKFQRVLVVARAVKKGANNPKTIEFEEALMTDDGAVAVGYRGTNAFGGVIMNYTVVAPDGRSASGTKTDIAKMWNKHIAKKQYDDFTSSVQGAQRLGAL